jgi:hypothetical protein
MVVSLKRVLIVLGLAFASTSLAHGQGIEHRVASSQSITSTVTVTATPQSPIRDAASSVLLAQDFSDHDLAHDDHNFAGSSLFQTTKTPFMTQSSLPVSQTRGGRLEVNFFMMSTNNKDVLRGPLTLSQSTQELAQPSFSDQYGISLGFHLGRDAGSSGSKGLRRDVSRVLRRR